MNENENKVMCDICGELHDVDECRQVRGGQVVCDDCIDSYTYCEHCDEWVHNDEVVAVNDGDEYWCTECADSYAYRCEDCGDYYSESRVYTDGNGMAICHFCYDHHDWHECAECHCFLAEGDGDWDEYDEEWYCDSCAAQRDREQAIHGYSYKPDPDFAYRRNERVGCLTFGVELEVDALRDDAPNDREETAQAVVDASNGRLYCKADGSLSRGFEIVSHPASLAYHTYDFRWANTCRICSKAGYRSHDTNTCGLHIHVGRAQLGQTGDERYATAGKLVILASALRDELTVFSRRKAEQLERWASFVAYAEPDCAGMDAGTAEAHRVNRAVDYAGDRYHAVNLRNHSTVEFRIFRGTLKRDTLIASLQLVSNLCEYAMTHTAYECNRATFAEIVNLHPYKELVAYSASKHLISTSIVAA